MGLFGILTSNNSAEVILIILGAWLIAITVAIVCHEFAHAWAANKAGDPTAKLAGRMTLNPIKHFDPVGTICLVLFGFGWAKGVPVNPTLFRNFKKGQIWVSLSGVLTNLALGVIFTFLSVVVDLFLDPSVLFFLFLQYLFFYVAIINYVLAVFNILPIFPLDGYNFLAAFLPYENKFLEFMRKYGVLILLGLLITGVFGYAINGMLSGCYFGLYDLFKMIFV